MGLGGAARLNRYPEQSDAAAPFSPVFLPDRHPRTPKRPALCGQRIGGGLTERSVGQPLGDDKQEDHHDLEIQDDTGRSYGHGYMKGTRMILCIPVSDEADRPPQAGVGPPPDGRGERLDTRRITDWQELDVGWDSLHDEDQGAHHARVARFLIDQHVDVVVAEHMGPGMTRMLTTMGIRIWLTALGDARAAVLAAHRRLAPTRAGGRPARRLGGPAHRWLRGGDGGAGERDRHLRRVGQAVVLHNVEATASSASRRSAGTPSGSWTSTRMSVTRAGRGASVYCAVTVSPSLAAREQVAAGVERHARGETRDRPASGRGRRGVRAAVYGLVDGEQVVADADREPVAVGVPDGHAAHPEPPLRSGTRLLRGDLPADVIDVEGGRQG